MNKIIKHKDLIPGNRYKILELHPDDAWHPDHEFNKTDIHYENPIGQILEYNLTETNGSSFGEYTFLVANGFPKIEEPEE